MTNTDERASIVSRADSRRRCVVVANGDGYVVVALGVVILAVVGVPLALLFGGDLSVDGLSVELAVSAVVLLTVLVIVGVFAQ